MNPTRITVLVPVFARIDHLTEMLSSLERQEPWVEQFIFVDDMNEDEIVRALRVFESKFPEKTTVISSDVPLGIARATRRGLDSVRTEYVAFVDSDDIVGDDAFRIVKSALEKNQELMLVSSRYETFADGDKRRNQVRRAGGVGRAKDFVEAIATTNSISHLKVVKVDLALRAQWFAAHDGVQDAILNFQLEPEDKILLIRSSLYRHRIHEGQHSNLLSSNAARELNFWRHAWLSRVLTDRNVDGQMRHLHSTEVKGPHFRSGGNFIRFFEASEDGSALNRISLLRLFVFRAKPALVLFKSVERNFGSKITTNRVTSKYFGALGFYLESSDPKSWSELRMFAGVFSYVVIDREVNLAIINPFLPPHVAVFQFDRNRLVKLERSSSSS